MSELQWIELWFRTIPYAIVVGIFYAILLIIIKGRKR